MPTISDYATNIIDPQDIALDSSGNLFVASRGRNSVLKVPTTSNPALGGTPSVVGAGQEPTGVAVDASGNVFTVFFSSTTLFKNGQPFISSETIAEPAALAVDAGGNIYISCPRKNRVVRVTAS